MSGSQSMSERQVTQISLLVKFDLAKFLLTQGDKGPLIWEDKVLSKATLPGLMQVLLKFQGILR